MDTTRDVIYDSDTPEECEPDGDNYIYMYGPGKSTMQLTAYPFSNQDAEYTLGFDCPMEVTMQVNYKWVFDCRQCYPCLDPETGQATGYVRGRWIPISMKKKTITVKGDITNPLFTFKGCASPAAKFSIQAGPQSAIITQPTMQYSAMTYNGLPLPFDTDSISNPWNLTVTTNANCSYAMGFKDVKAYLTSFSFTYSPPNPPTTQWSFEVPISYCPEC